MTRFFTSRQLRWAVPALVAAGVVMAAITTTNGAGASEPPNLPPKTAAQLLTAVAHSRPANLSGSIVETANLGLPDLPDLPTGDVAGAGGMSWQTLLTGSHTVRVWYAGPTQQRLALIAPMSEQDLVHNGKDVWTYTSTTNKVTHMAVPSTAHLGSLPTPEEAAVTPQQAAKKALRAVDPSTQVSVDGTARVAGRAAYELSLTPRDSRSLVGSIRIAIDAATSMPLQVQVFASGSSTPAIQVGFTDISYSAPSPSVFDFVPPAGATVSEQQPPAAHADLPDGSDQLPALGEGSSQAANLPTVLGNGWTTVVKVPAAGQLAGANAELLNRISTAVPAGRLITTSLVSVLVGKDGYVYAGSVSGAALQHVAATGRGL